MIQDGIAGQLIALAENDLRVREILLTENSLSKGYNPKMEQVHRQNAAQLRVIISQIGWPTQARVGEKASDAAWLIAQHSIGEADFMRYCYSLMLESASDVNSQNLAYLHDRICFFEQKPQRFGTQYDNGNMYPVENAAELNTLRAQMQLPAVEPDRIVDAGSVKQMYSDTLESDSDFQLWRRQAGWI